MTNAEHTPEPGTEQARRLREEEQAAPAAGKETRALVFALARAARREHDFAEYLIHVLGYVAAELGSAGALTAGRPGSWESGLVSQLVHDDYLPPRLSRRKLADSQVIEIWENWIMGGTTRGIGADFGVAASTISSILAGTTWRSVSIAHGYGRFFGGSPA